MKILYGAHESFLQHAPAVGLSSSTSHSAITTSQLIQKWSHNIFEVKLKHLLHKCTFINNAVSGIKVTNVFKAKPTQMGRQYLLFDDPEIQAGWTKDIQTAFFKCTNWQLEETLDPINCPYHYYCNSRYPGDYSYIIDVLVLAFTTALYLTTVTFTLMEMYSQGNQTRLRRSKRYLLPSGPLTLPIFLLVIAKGQRINTIYPLMFNGPAILQLVRISALAFENEVDSDIKFVFLEASTISGIMHAALYLDAVILPYYTGLDALMSSTFSGECISCICRNKSLSVGGMLVSHSGWSVTTAMVVSTICLRIITRLTTENKGKTMLIKLTFETISWFLIIVESAYLIIIPPREGILSKTVSFGGVFLLTFLHITRRICTSIGLIFRGNQDNKGAI